MATAPAPKIDMQELDKFMQKFVGDLGASMSAVLVLVGDQLGLYRAMDAAGHPISAAELAALTATEERYVREWLNAMAAAGYVRYHEENHHFSLSPEQAFALAQEDSPAYIPGAFQIVSSMFKDEHKGDGGFSFRRRGGVARASSLSFRRNRAIFPAELCCESCRAMDPRTRWREREAGKGRYGGGCRLRAWILDNPDGAVLPEFEILRIRLSPGFDREGPRTRQARRRRRSNLVPGRDRQGLPWHALRPGDIFRLPARHG